MPPGQASAARGDLGRREEDSSGERAHDAHDISTPSLLPDVGILASSSSASPGSRQRRRETAGTMAMATAAATRGGQAVGRIYTPLKLNLFTFDLVL